MKKALASLVMLAFLITFATPIWAASPEYMQDCTKWLDEYKRLNVYKNASFPFAWAKQYINYVIYFDIMLGKDQGWTYPSARDWSARKVKIQPLFDPGANITRAEFAAILSRSMDGSESAKGKLTSQEKSLWQRISSLLVRIFGIDTAYASGGYAGFKDLTGKEWFAKYVKDLVDKNIICPAEYNYVLKPKEPIPRWEIAVWVGRATRLCGIKPTKEAKEFSDIPTTMKYHDEIVEAARYGIIEGYPDGTFQPDKPVNRAEAAAMMYRFFKQLKVHPATQKDVNEMLNVVKAVFSKIQYYDNLAVFHKPPFDKLELRNGKYLNWNAINKVVIDDPNFFKKTFGDYITEPNLELYVDPVKKELPKGELLPGPSALVTPRTGGSFAEGFISSLYIDTYLQSYFKFKDCKITSIELGDNWAIVKASVYTEDYHISGIMTSSKWSGYTICMKKVDGKWKISGVIEG